ncbi:MAG: CHAP domain-containing protein [Bacteroidota bacterium]
MKKDQKMYITEDGVRFRKPSDDPDGIENMSKGQEVIFVDGPWFRVTKDGKTGWVHSDYLSETNPNPVQPTQQGALFIKGQSNLFDSPTTIAIRKIINDEFGGGINKWDLQCTEYAMFCVKTKCNVDIQWPVKSGRDGGKWADIFEQHKQYTVLSEPKTNCVVCLTEVRRKDGTLTKEGHIAFVEEALPDGSIKISEANWPGSGIYNERPISKAEWQNKYKARFVSFI